MKIKLQKHHQKSPIEERWAFSLSSDRLFVLGATANRRYVAFRMADGELRLLSL